MAAEQASTRRLHALPVQEAVEAELPNATAAERRELLPLICVEWHRACSHVEDRLAYLARHAGKRCPV